MYWFIALNLLCSLAIIRCEYSKPLETERKMSIENYNNVDNDSFEFRYRFDDGSFASGRGVLVDGKKYRLQSGVFRFNMRGKVYEFKYDIGEDGAVHGSLVSDSSNGTITIEEKFETDGEVVNNGFGLTCSRKVYREPYEYEWFIKLLFPANTKHPVFMCTLLGHKDALKTHFECVTYENRSESVVSHTLNKPEAEWRYDFVEPVSRTLSYENHHDGMGRYNFNYKFINDVSGEASISEIGQLNANNTAASINGLITFKDLRLNYTANATTYNVSLYYTDMDGLCKQKEFLLRYMEFEDAVAGVKRQGYSDGKECFLIANRELTYVDGDAFVKAIIRLGVSHPSGKGVFFQSFQIAEVLSDSSLLIGPTNYDLNVGGPISPEVLASLVGRK